MTPPSTPVITLTAADNYKFLFHTGFVACLAFLAAAVHFAPSTLHVLARLLAILSTSCFASLTVAGQAGDLHTSSVRLVAPVAVGSSGL